MQKIEAKNKKENFSEQIKEHIISGQLKAGDRLPPERELAKIYGISRGSVNQAILDLERAGFIRVVPRKGAYVADFFENSTPETLFAIMDHGGQKIDMRLFRDFMDMRVLIECECARLACKNKDAVIIEQLHQCIEKLYSSDEEEVTDAIFDFHRYIVQLSGNCAYSMVFSSFENPLRNLIRAHYSVKNELRKSMPYFNELAFAIVSGNEDAAVELLAKVLYNAECYDVASSDTTEGLNERKG